MVKRSTEPEVAEPDELDLTDAEEPGSLDDDLNSLTEPEEVVAPVAAKKVPAKKAAKAAPPKAVPAKKAAAPAKKVAAPVANTAVSDKELNQLIRAWGKENYPGAVGDRGRLHPDLVNAYNNDDLSLFTPGEKKAASPVKPAAKKNVAKAMAPRATSSAVPAASGSSSDVLFVKAGASTLVLQGNRVLGQLVPFEV